MLLVTQRFNNPAACPPEAVNAAVRNPVSKGSDPLGHCALEPLPNTVLLSPGLQEVASYKSSLPLCLHMFSLSK